MPNEGFKPTSINLGEAGKQGSPEQGAGLPGFKQDETVNFSARVLSQIPWLGNQGTDHPVFVDIEKNPELLTAMRAASQLEPNRDAEKRVLAALDKRLDEIS